MTLNGRTTTRLVSSVASAILLVCARAKRDRQRRGRCTAAEKRTSRPSQAQRGQQPQRQPSAKRRLHPWFRLCRWGGSAHVRQSPGVLAAAALASSCTVTPSLAKARMIACQCSILLTLRKTRYAGCRRVGRPSTPESRPARCKRVKCACAPRKRGRLP